MKRRVLSIIVAIISLGFFVELSQPVLQNTRLAWVNLDWLVGRDNFYFKKGQWLADARTVVAAVRFLSESGNFNENNALATSRHPSLIPTANSNNASGIGRPGTFNRFLMAPADPQE
jgi:hypothetical protein